MMPIATHPETGQTVFLGDDGQWQPAQTAVNPQTKEMMAFDGKDWTAVPAHPSVVADIIKSAGIGLAKGGIGLAGMGGDLRELAATGAGKVAGLFGGSAENAQAATRAALRATPLLGPVLSGPSSHGIQGVVEDVTGPFYKPQTTAGEFAQTAGEFAPAALAGPGGLARRAALQVAAPAVASETAGQATKGSAAEPYARIGAALAAGPAASAAAMGARRLISPGVSNVPGNIERVAGVDVPLSGGQASGDVTAQILENAALRGGRGQPAQQVAEEFFQGRQAPAVAQSRDAVGRSLDNFGMNVVGGPQEAAEMAGESVRNIERASRRNYGDLYDTALTMPGEIHAAAFEGIGQRIKGELSLSRNPVIIDDVTTPIASRAIQDIDNTISRLRIQNRADPFGQPNPENITGVNLQGVDQARKRLISMAQSAERGSADRRAVGRVISAFDNQVEDAIAGGLFTGDDRALDALREARAAYAQHRQTFRTQGAGDDVGRAMERIIGRNGGEGATSNEIANYLYGEAKVGSKGVSVRLTHRIRDVLGADSPEWSGVRQGLWSRLTEATEGATPFGPQKTAQRIADFLNGGGTALARTMFTPQERQLMAEYAGLQRRLIPRAGAVNYSNTSTVGAALKSVAGSLMVALGDVLGGVGGAVAGHLAGGLGSRLTEGMAARGLRRQLYQPIPNPALPRAPIMPPLQGPIAAGALAGQQTQN